MKHFIYNSHIICTILILITCWNGSLVETSEKKRPDVNFYGTITVHSSTQKTIEDILIGGKYEEIPVYENNESKPSTVIDPKKNKIFLDLHNISSIELKYPDSPTEHELKISNQQYIEIIVTFITGSKQTYMVETSREISCLEIDKGSDNLQNPINKERKLSFIHAKKLIINGYKSGEPTKKSKKYEKEDKVDAANNTEKTLDQIEKNVNNLSKDSSNYETIKNSLLSLLRTLRNQIHKLLSMIKD